MPKFRSKFEENFFKSIKPGSVTYESAKLAYIVPASHHIYHPDFHLVGTNTWIELKGIWSAADRRKMVLVKEQHPDKRIIMVFQDAKKPISKGSKTSYQQWAIKNGIEVMSINEVLKLIHEMH